MLDLPISKLRAAARPVLNADGTVTVPAISYSAIDQYLRCPQQFKFRYIEGRKEPPAVALMEGTSHHKACELDNKSKLEKGKQLSSKQMMEIFESTWKSEMETAKKDADELKTKLEWEDDDEEGILKRGKILQTDYANNYSRLIEPTAAEKEYMAEVDVRGIKFRVMGQIDVTTKNTVWDYKTAKRPKSVDDQRLSLQLSLYSWVEKLPEVSYIAFIKAAKPYVQYMAPMKVTPGRWMWSLDVIASAVDGIRRGSFPKTNPAAFPPPWWCSERHCGYWMSCRGKYEA